MVDKLVKGRFEVPVDAAAVAGDWGARGFSCEAFVDPPGREWLGFVHATNELVTVLEGRLALTVGLDEFILEAGDEAFIPRGAVHSVRNVHRAATRWLYGYD